MNARGAEPRFFLDEGDPPSKQSILRAALGLFVKHGLAGTNVRMIGDRRIEAAAGRRPFEAALGEVLGAFLGAMDEDLEAVLFVQDALRELWPRLPAAARKRSILRQLRELLERGIREGAVTGYASSDVPVAALVGLVAQLGRMLYFGEVAGPARLRRAELELALRRMLKG